MTAELLDGKAVSARVLAELIPRVKNFTERSGRPPLLTVLSVGDDPSASLFTRQQMRLCGRTGIKTRVEKLSAACGEAEIFRLLDALEKDRRVDGIILESPLPPPLSLSRILEHLPPEKDVEGLNPANFGRLFACNSFEAIKSAGLLIPPTAHAIVSLLIRSKVPIQGKAAVVVGRSDVVGKPAAHLLSTLNATVTLCHSKTVDLKRYLKTADIVVAAMGRPQLIQGADLKPGAAVVDAGVNCGGSRVVGDVDFAGASKVAAYISPVPGGVGPLTTAMLLSNVLLCAERIQR